jgi:hypothetical protein
MFKIKFCYFEYGEKNTGGYSIALNRVETEKNIIISVKEISPEPDSLSHQGFTTFCEDKFKRDCR